jgi:ketosteroid isomerase-like protein
MVDFIGFDNDFPRDALVHGLDHEPTLDDVGSVRTGSCEHLAKIDLVEVSVFHALFEMRGELDLPFPPIRPADAPTVPRRSLALPWPGPERAASNAGDDAGEGDIYRDDVELEYPQSGERFRGRRNVLESRGHNPARRRFEIRRTLGSGDLWVTEYVIFYDGRAVPTVSIMEFRDGKVEHETQYFADPFEAPAWRSRWRETKR